MSKRNLDFYFMVDVPAEREVSILSAESVMRAINYDNFLSKPISLVRQGLY